MTEQVTADDSLLATAKRALGYVDARGGVGVAKSSHRIDRGLNMALVELMVENIKAGYVTPPGFLQRPGHLPDDDRELRLLATSDVPRDATLKADLIEWQQIDRRVVGQGAVTLKNAIVAVRLADELLNDCDDNDQQIAEWKSAIEAHLWSTYKVTAVEVPQPGSKDGSDPVLAWCEALIAKHSPIPAWLRTGEIVPKNLFVPTERKQKSNLRRYEPKEDDDA